VFGFGILDDRPGDEPLRILLDTSEELSIEGVRFIRDSVELTRRSYGALLLESPPVEYFGMEFLTPILFGAPYGFPYLFPELRRVFGSVVRA